MFCEKCNKSSGSGARFCKYCGLEISLEESNKKRLRNILIFALVGVFMIIFAGIFVFVLNSARKPLLPSSVESNNAVALKDSSANSPVFGKAYTVPGLHLKLVYVAPGTFKMGSDNGEIDEKPRHKVTISRGYWIGKYELTQRQYHSLMNMNPSYFKGPENPVECVSWQEAMDFCAELSRVERLAGRLPKDYEYRLPTEAEWEYAASGGDDGGDFKYSGSNTIDEVGWYDNNSEGTSHKVGTKKPNELGIYDMSGNVWEWCFDTCNESGVLPGVSTDTYKYGIVDPVNRQYYHVFRGGGWYRGADLCRVSKRAANVCNKKLYYLGFRVVLAPVIRK